MKKLHALILGATGATGKELVKLLLEDSNFSQVSVFVRRKIDVDHKKFLTFDINGKFKGTSELPKSLKIRAKNHFNGLGYTNNGLFV